MEPFHETRKKLQIPTANIQRSSNTQAPRTWFMVPMHSFKEKEAANERKSGGGPPHATTLSPMWCFSACYPPSTPAHSRTQRDVAIARIVASAGRVAPAVPICLTARAREASGRGCHVREPGWLFGQRAFDLGEEPLDGSLLVGVQAVDDGR